MSDPAIIAAHQATDATAALLLHATEGGGFGDVEVVGKFAEALVLSIDIHVASSVEECDTEYLAELDALRNAAAKFIEGWVG